MTYKEYEKKVYDWLTGLRKENPDLYFSTRMKSSKGAELDLFIGTSNSKYFGTTFWNIPVAYPGASSDFANLIFKQRGNKFTYYIQVNTSKTAEDQQNEFVLEVARQMRDVKSWLWERADSTGLERQMERTRIKPPKKEYKDIDKMLADAERDVLEFIAQFDQVVTLVKEEHPALIADRLTENDHKIFQQRLAWRQEKYGKSKINTSAGADETQYFIIGSKYGKDASIDIYPRLREENVVATGFAGEHNLQEYVGEEQSIIIDYLKSLGEPSNSYTAMKRFLNIRPGDLIAVKSTGSPLGTTANLEIVAIGKAVERNGEFYNYDPDGLGHTIQVEWLEKDIHRRYQLAYGATIHQLSQADHIAQIFGGENSSSVMVTNEANVAELAKNTILYGPPGTGKTYATIERAVLIANPEFDKGQDREFFRAEYERLRKTGQIVFTTFHQSLSYEDFVEGIKPITEDENIGYVVQHGIFRQLVTNSAYSIFESQRKEDAEEVLNFSDKFDQYLSTIENIQKGDGPRKIRARNGGTIESAGFSTRGNLQFRHHGEGIPYPVSKERITRLHRGIGDMAQVTNINTAVRDVIGGANASVYWAVLGDIRSFNSEPREKKSVVNISYTEKVEEVKSLLSTDYQSTADNYVLIIDEINRGNVSRIFGELITLLEPDKRLGQPEELTVTLPYSRDTFGVPPNLYLIGTMNTADRSVVALDSALRRRFRFVEVAPDPEVIRENLDGTLRIGDFDLDRARLMEVINQRVEFLLDHDHCIGHSYFLKMRTAKDVAEQFATGIVPLLREYFYEDYRQLLLVLGQGFVTTGKQLSAGSFPAGADTADFDVSDYTRYEIRDFRGKTGGLAGALRILLNDAEDQAAEA